MEDIQRRVEYGSISIQLQAVEKLYVQVKEKRPAGVTLSAATPEYPELQALWQYAGSCQHAVARRVCHLLVQLLQEGMADFSYILNGLLNLVPTAKNIQGIVEAVGQLLCLQVTLLENTGDGFSSHYNMRNPPHPFISIVTNRPTDSWPLVLEQMAALISHTQPVLRRNSLIMLDSFLRFVLLDPNQPEQLSNLRHNLKLTLVSAVSQDQTDKEKVVTYLLKMLVMQQVSSVQDVAMTTQFCTQVLHMFTIHGVDLEDRHGRRLSTHALSLCLRNHQCNLDYGSLLQAIWQLCQLRSKVFATDLNLAILGQMLSVLDLQESVLVLSIVKAILQTTRELSALCSGFVILGTINILATPYYPSLGPVHKQAIGLASEVVLLVQERMQAHSVSMDDNEGDLEFLTSETYEARTGVQLAHKFSTDATQLSCWLKGLHQHINNMQVVPHFLTNLLVSVLAWSPDTAICKLAINRLLDVAMQQPSQGPSILPVLLYLVGRKSCPDVRLALMEAIPKLATHKYNVVPVLRTIQSFSNVPQLKSMSIRLLTDLWSLQDRCFPHLLKVILQKSKVTTSGAVGDEVILAQAHAIKEVCRLKPEQHGSDMLAPLCDILTSCTDTKSGAAAALALEALYYVCDAEVIDLISAWKVLESSLVKETRPVVVQKICELLSLVPGLQVNTDQYEEFVKEMVRRLWRYSQTDEPRVVSAAFCALSKFGVDNFKISHFQYQIVEEYIKQAESVIAAMEEGDALPTVDDVIPSVPGICYLRLLDHLDPANMTGYRQLLCSLVAKEVAALPRGIYYSSMRQQGTPATLGKLVPTIPCLIQTQYEKTKHPGLRPELAAALLYCYNPAVEVGRDGRPRKHYTMTHGKNFQQMFITLLHDIPIQPSNWHRILTLPHAWTTFMERLFTSMTEARKAEIDLQLSRDFLDEQEAANKRCIAWLWVRDTLVDTVKKATKGNPSIQFNAVLALSGLTLVTQRYYGSLKGSEREVVDGVTEYQSHGHWVMRVIDSCMSLLDFSHTPKTSLLGLCQQRSVTDRLPASVLAQAASILALQQLVPIILAYYIELVYTIVNLLVERLPGHQGSFESPSVLHTFRGLGLGMFLGNLVHESFTNMAGSKGLMTVMETLDALEECCFSQAENRMGSLLGLAFCLGSLCYDGSTESRVHVAAVQARLQKLLVATPTTDQMFQPMCVSFASVTGTSFVTNCLESEVADAAWTTLTGLLSQNKENVGLHLAVGLLGFGLSFGGHASVGNQMEKLTSDWLICVADKDSPPLERVAALTGLSALVGSEGTLLKMDSGAGSQVMGTGSKDKVIETASQILLSADNDGILGNTGWLLSNLYMSTCSVSQTTSTVPTTYSYLPETSILRSVIDLLLRAGRQGPEAIPSDHVVMLLKSVQEEVTGTLPPLNWTGVLSPLMKLPFSDEVKQLCVQLSVRLCGSSTTAALFVSSWMVPPLFLTLPDSCKCEILASCSQLMRAVTPTMLQAFLDKTVKPLFTQRDQIGLLPLAALQGLDKALCVKDPPEAVVAMLYQAVTEVVQLTGSDIDYKLLSSLSECLRHLPDQLFDEMTARDCTDRHTITRGTFLRCYLVACGHQPVALLNSCIDAAFNEDCDRETILYLLSVCFTMMKSSKSQMTEVMPRAQWLLEIMGHVRNIVTGVVQLSREVNVKEVSSFAVNIIAAAIGAWTSNLPQAVQSLNLDTLTTKQKVSSDWSAASETSSLGSDVSELMLPPLDLLPSCMKGFENEPWSETLQKVLDWLIFMCEGESLSPWVQQSLYDCLMGLRNNSSFKKTAVWTKACSSFLMTTT